MKTRFFKLALAATFAFAATSASAAGTATDSLGVSATVANKCVIATGTWSVGFGDYDPIVTNSSTGVDVTGNGSFSLKCTKKATGVEVRLGPGTHMAVANTFPRRMSDGVASPDTGFLEYHLYKPTDFATMAGCSTTEWGDGTAGTSVTVGSAFWTGASADNTVPICGKILKGQDVPAGNYSDTVAITVNF